MIGCGSQRIPSKAIDFCGDSSIAGLEECDDGNRTNGDGCSRLCEVEEGYLCRGQPSYCNKACEPNCDEDTNNENPSPSDETANPPTATPIRTN